MNEAFLRLQALRAAALDVRDPTVCDETLCRLLELAKGAERVLEIGAAECLTSIAIHLATGAEVTSIELDALRAQRARENIAAFGAGKGVRLLEGDAGEILPCLEGTFDLIFLDGPKAQYRRYFADCKRLLRRGGVLVSDDVLFLGREKEKVPKKRRMLFEHIGEYLAMLGNDPDFETQISEIGEGLAVSRKLL